MLYPCIEGLLHKLNQHVKLRTGLSKDLVVSATSVHSNLLNNKIIMSLVDIDMETGLNVGTNYIEHGNRFLSKNNPVTFKINLLFASHFADLELDGLKYLALIIGFFQANNCIKINIDPSRQEMLSASILNLTEENKSAMWSRIGASYMPSIVYKISSISIEDLDHGILVPKVTDIAIDRGQMN